MVDVENIDQEVNRLNTELHQLRQAVQDFSTVLKRISNFTTDTGMEYEADDVLTKHVNCFPLAPAKGKFKMLANHILEVENAALERIINIAEEYNSYQYQPCGDPGHADKLCSRCEAKNAGAAAVAQLMKKELKL